tara:strand:- start:1296 stop:1487 length:192 start_codon:yes stop_codon:yes gene_type:complete
MNFTQTQELIKQMSDIENWAQSYCREMDKPTDLRDEDKLKRFKRWIDEAKEAIFHLANELAKA